MNQLTPSPCKNISDFNELITASSTLCQIKKSSALSEWIFDEVFHDTFLITNDDSTANAAANAAEEIFKNKLKSCCGSFPVIFANHIKSTDLVHDLFNYFINFMEVRVKSILINSPDNDELSKSWKEFLCDIAYLRYERNSIIVTRVNKFILYLIEENKRISEQFEKCSYEEKLWKEWENILKCPDLLDVELAEFYNESYSVPDLANFVQLPVKTLQIAFSSTLCSLVENLSWIPHKIKDLLTPYLSEPQNKLFNNSKLKVYLIDDIIKNLIPQTSLLTLDDLKNTPNSSSKVTLLTKKFLNLTKASNSNIILGIFECYHNFITQIKYVIENFDNESAANNINFIGIKNIIAEIESPCDVSILKKRLKILKIQQKCHVLFDTYITRLVHKLDFISTGIDLWHKKYSSLGKLDLYIKLINRQNPPFMYSNKLLSLDIPLDRQKIDELLESIEGPKKPVKGKKKSPKAGEVQTNVIPSKHLPENNTHEKRSVKSKNLKSPIPSTAHIASIPLITSRLNLPYSISTTKLALQLKSLIVQELYQSNDFVHPRGALRQSLMHLEDLNVNTHRLYNLESGPIIHAALHAVSIVSSAYYHMEQLIRFMRLKNNPYDSTFLCDEHNLKKILNELNADYLTDATAASQLYLGNAWTFHTFEQLNGWKSLEQDSNWKTPKPLKIINTALKKDDIKEITSTLKGYTDSTLAFSEPLLSSEIKECKAILKDTTQIPYFSHQQQFNLKTVDFALNSCHRYIEILEARTNHAGVLKIKQAHQNLIVLKGILTIINKMKIGADAFSQLVRGAIFWQNGVLESLLQGIYFLQTGIDNRDHNLLTLYTAIKWTQTTNTSKMVDLSIKWDKWDQVNNLCRYPFQHKEIRSSTHELILQAELLREHPELGLGFKPQGKFEKNQIATLLNFIPVASDDLSAEGLLKALNSLMESAWELIEYKLIPELDLIVKQIDS